MRPFSMIAVFCEDIREEKAGTDTLVGVLPDNLAIGTLPGLLGKLGVYFRFQLEEDSNPKVIRARLRIPGGQIFEVATFSDLIETAKAQAKDAGTPYSGLIAKGTFSPLPVTQVGRIEAILEVDGTEYICGVLNLVQVAGAVHPSIAISPSPPA